MDGLTRVVVSSFASLPNPGGSMLFCGGGKSLSPFLVVPQDGSLGNNNVVPLGVGLGSFGLDFALFLEDNRNVKQVLLHVDQGFKS